MSLIANRAALNGLFTSVWAIKINNNNKLLSASVTGIVSLSVFAFLGKK